MTISRARSGCGRADRAGWSGTVRCGARSIDTSSRPSSLVEVAAAHVVGQLALAVRSTRFFRLFEFALVLLHFALRLQALLHRIGALREVGGRVAILLVG